MRASLSTLFLAACFAYVPRAQAHICMEAPVSRVGPSCTSASAQKPGPCGINTRSTQYVTEFKPGETIMVAINETINHGSHYRIAFNPNGSSFEDPTSVDDKSGGHPFVLLDGIEDVSAAKQMVTVTLPNVTCDKCTLQLIQVMYDKGGNGFGNDDIYYSCADIVLKGTPAANPDAGAGDAGSTGDAGSGAPARPAFDAGSPPVDSGGGPTMGSDSGSPTGPVFDAGQNQPATPDAGSSDASSVAQGDAGAAPAEGDEDDQGGCSVLWSDRERGLPLGLLLGSAMLTLAIRRRRRS